MTDPQRTGQALDVLVGAFVEELVRSGVRHACVCPGSRSTPLALLLARQPGMQLWMHLDERSAAYFGLGLARTLREPVALLATSGTAAANFLPAVVEASYARVPLVVLTADRPHELRDCGAPQTIDQLRLYGQHARWFFDLPEPDASTDAIRHVRTIAARAASTARSDPAGPVHLNWPFREPLLPEPPPWPASPPQPESPPSPGLPPQPESPPWSAADGPASRPAEPLSLEPSHTPSRTASQRPSPAPSVSVALGRRAPSADLVRDLAGAFGQLERGLVVCGPHDDPDLPPAVAALASRLGYPILADPLSGVRCGPHDRSLVLDAYDAFLRDRATVERLGPEVILRLGAMPTSKPVLQLLERYPSARQVVVDAGGWREPSGLATDVLHVDPVLLCQAVRSALPAQRQLGTWSTEWLDVDRLSRRAIDEHLAQLGELSEPGLFTTLAKLLPAGSTLFAGNSMPVRDLDTFFPASERAVRFLSNRGANGIDGVVSSALGASAASRGPVVLVIGDLSFYHDLNGLLGARRHTLDLLIILVNNDGGGIFSFLPQADLPEAEFELLFGTPHGLDFRPLVQAYGGAFERVLRRSELEPVLTTALAQAGLRVVEVPTNRARNVVVHRDIWKTVSAALAAVVAL